MIPQWKKRDEFRASKIMLDRAKKNPKIKFLTNKVIKEVVGVEENGKKSMTGVILEDTKDHSTMEFKADGLFIGIGHQPNTNLFKDWLDMDETGYLKTKPGSTYTNVEGLQQRVLAVWRPWMLSVGLKRKSNKNSN